MRHPLISFVVLVCQKNKCQRAPLRSKPLRNRFKQSYVMVAMVKGRIGWSARNRVRTVPAWVATSSPSCSLRRACIAMGKKFNNIPEKRFARVAMAPVSAPNQTFFILFETKHVFEIYSNSNLCVWRRLLSVAATSNLRCVPRQRLCSLWSKRN